MHFKIILLFILKSIISESSAAVYVLNLQKPENNMLHWNDGVNLPTRRLYSFHPGHTDTILGAPRTSMHLPEAEPILPGHTLLRPGFSMLRSAVKFPHKDYVDGSGVYGNLNNLGITYDNTGERVLYTGFRRYDANNLINDISDSPGIIVLLRPKEKNVLSSSKTRDWPRDRSLHAKIPMQKYNFDFGSQLDYVRYNENEPIKSYAPFDTKYAFVDLENIPEYLVARTVPLKPRIKLSMKNVDNENSSSNFESDPEKKANEAKKQKLIRYLNTKNAFNHIKISPDAPDYKQLRPITHPSNEKRWWYYHQSDYEPFSSRKQYIRE